MSHVLQTLWTAGQAGLCLPSQWELSYWQLRPLANALTSMGKDHSYSGRHEKVATLFRVGLHRSVETTGAVLQDFTDSSISHQMGSRELTAI